MPTYDYVCDGCGHEFELFQQMTERVRRTCPECRKRRLRRLVGTGAGVIFRGSGFYQTDYRSDSYRKSAEADKKSAEGKKTPDTSADGKKKGKKPSTDASKKSSSSSESE